jgi:hypothetical protein
VGEARVHRTFSPRGAYGTHGGSGGPSVSATFRSRFHGTFLWRGWVLACFRPKWPVLERTVAGFANPDCLGVPGTTLTSRPFTRSG